MFHILLPTSQLTCWHTARGTTSGGRGQQGMCLCWCVEEVAHCACTLFVVPAAMRLCCCALQVLVQIVDNHVHRVYICKDNDKGQEVVGVVTPTDILSLIAGKHWFTNGPCNNGTEACSDCLDPVSQDTHTLSSLLILATCLYVFIWDVSDPFVHRCPAAAGLGPEACQATWLIHRAASW